MPVSCLAFLRLPQHACHLPSNTPERMACDMYELWCQFRVILPMVWEPSVCLAGE